MWFQYSILLIVLLLLEIGLGVLTFILKDKGWIKNQATYGLRNFILHYREDPDQQNLIDYIQQQWECCGIDTPSGECLEGVVGLKGELNVWDLRFFSKI